MHIFRLKEGSKSFEWVKGVIDKERKQRVEYCDRIRKAVPFLLTRVIASFANSTFSRKLEIYELLLLLRSTKHWIRKSGAGLIVMIISSG